MKRLISFVLALIMTLSVIPAEAVDILWYEPTDDDLAAEIPPIMPSLEWPDVTYAQTGFFEYIETEWGYNYYDRVEGTTVNLPAKSVPIQYTAELSEPIEYDDETWEYMDTLYGTAPGLTMLPSHYEVSYLHFYCEGDPNEAGQPVWLGECIPLGMEPDEWRERVLADLLPAYEEWLPGALAETDEEYQDMIDLNMFMMEKDGGWDWEAFLDKQTDLKFTSSPNLPIMTDYELTGGHGEDVYSDRYYVTLLRISHSDAQSGNFSGSTLEDCLNWAQDHWTQYSENTVEYHTDPYLSEYFVDFTGPDSAPFVANAEEDTLRINVVSSDGTPITTGVSYSWFDRTAPERIYSTTSSVPYAGPMAWRCELTFDETLSAEYITENMSVDFIPGDLRPRTVTLVPRQTYKIKGNVTNPGAAVMVTVEEPGGDRIITPEIAEDGSFECDVLRYATAVTITAPECNDYNLNFVFTKFPPDESRVSDLGTITLEPDSTIHALKVKITDAESNIISDGITYRWYQTDSPDTTLSENSYYNPDIQSDYRCEITFSNKLCLLYDTTKNYTVDFSGSTGQNEKTVHLTKRVYTVKGKVAQTTYAVFYIRGGSTNNTPTIVPYDENGNFEFELTYDTTYFSVNADGYVSCVISDLFTYCRADTNDVIDLGKIRLLQAPLSFRLINQYGRDVTSDMVSSGDVQYRWFFEDNYEETLGTDCKFIPSDGVTDEEGYYSYSSLGYACEVTFSDYLYRTYDIPKGVYRYSPLSDVHSIELIPRISYTIKGQVEAPGATVKLTVSEADGDVVLSPELDANGCFIVENVMNYPVSISVSAENYESVEIDNIFARYKPDAKGISDIGKITLNKIISFKATVVNENYVPITDGITYRWYAEDNPYVTLSDTDSFSTTSISTWNCAISFDDDFRDSYKISENLVLSFTGNAENEDRKIVVQERKTYTVKGKVTPADADISVVVSELAGEREINVVPDESGNFSVEVKDYPTKITVSKDKYSSYTKDNIFNTCRPDKNGIADLGDIEIKEIPFNRSYPIEIENTTGEDFKIAGHTVILYVKKAGSSSSRLNEIYDVTVEGNYIVIGEEGAAKIEDGDIIQASIAEFDTDYPLVAEPVTAVYASRNFDTPGTIKLQVRKKTEIRFNYDSSYTGKIGVAIFSGADLVSDGIIIDHNGSNAGSMVKYYMPVSENACTIICWSDAEGVWEKLESESRIEEIENGYFRSSVIIEDNTPLIVNLSDVPKKETGSNEWMGDFSYTFAIDESNMSASLVPIVLKYSGAGEETDEKEFIIYKQASTEAITAGFMPLYGNVYVKDLDTNEAVDAEVIQYKAGLALRITTNKTSGNLYFAVRSIGGKLAIASYGYTASEERAQWLKTLTLPDESESVDINFPSYTTTKNLTMEMTVCLPNYKKKGYKASVWINGEMQYERDILRGTYRLPISLTTRNQVDIFKVELVIKDKDGNEYYHSEEKKLTYYPAEVPTPKKLSFKLTNGNITNEDGVKIDSFNLVKRVTTGSVDYETGKRENPKFTVPDYNINADGTMKYNVVYNFELEFSNDIANLKADSVELIAECGIYTEQVTMEQNSDGIFIGKLVLEKNKYTVSDLPQNISVAFDYSDDVSLSQLTTPSVVQDYLTTSIEEYKKILDKINNTEFCVEMEHIDLDELENVLRYEMDGVAGEGGLSEEVIDTVLDIISDCNLTADVQDCFRDEMADVVNGSGEFIITTGEELNPMFGEPSLPTAGNRINLLNPSNTTDENGDSTVLNWEVDTGTVNSVRGKDTVTIDYKDYDVDHYDIDGERVYFLTRKETNEQPGINTPATIIMNNDGSVIYGYEPSEEEEKTADGEINIDVYPVKYDDYTGITTDITKEPITADDIYTFELPQSYYEIGALIGKYVTYTGLLLTSIDGIIDTIMVYVRQMNETKELLQERINTNTVTERQLKAVINTLATNSTIRLSETSKNFINCFMDGSMSFTDLEKQLSSVQKTIREAVTELNKMNDVSGMIKGSFRNITGFVTKIKAMQAASTNPVIELFGALTKPVSLVDVIITPILAIVDIYNEYETLTNKISSREMQIAWALQLYYNSGNYTKQSECSDAVNDYIKMLERENVEDITLLMNTVVVSAVGIFSSVAGAVSSFFPDAVKKLDKISTTLTLSSFALNKLNLLTHAGVQALEIVISSESEREDLVCEKCPANEVVYKNRSQENIWLVDISHTYKCLSVIDHKLVWDPAGYVYEAVASNRVEGATVKAYYRDEDGSTVFWDASEYDEVNPLITDENGQYSWMTPEGDWLVTAEKEGYESGDSRNDPAAVDGWLPVLPPQVNVNIPLVSYEAPTVTSLAAASNLIQVEFSKYMDEAYLMAHPDLITVRENGVSVPVTLAFSDREISPVDSSVYYGRKLVISKANGELFAGSVSLSISGGIKSYAGTEMGIAYDSGTLSFVQIAATISHSYPNRLVMKKGDSFELSVSLTDTLGQPIPNTTVTMAELDGTIIDATPCNTTSAQVYSVTDEKGIARFNVTALESGYDVLTFNAGNAEELLRVGVTEPESLVTAKPTANISDYATVTKGTRLTLSCTTDDAVIRYTLNNTCPCSDGALVYGDAITITEDTYIRIAAWTEEGGYSERLNLHISCVEAEPENAISVTELTDAATVTANINLVTQSPDADGIVFVGTYNGGRLLTVSKYDAHNIMSISIDKNNAESLKIIWCDDDGKPVCEAKEIMLN